MDFNGIRIKRAVLGAVLFTIAICLSAAALNVKKDETVVFYPTLAVRDAGAGVWEVPIHAHVYEMEEDSVFRKATVALLEKTLGAASYGTSDIFNRRMRMFMVDNQGWKNLAVKIGGTTYILKNTQLNGHVEDLVRIPDDEMKALRARSADRAWIKFDAVLPGGDARRFEGFFRIMPEKPLFIISDIDDTLKISDVRNKSELLRNTFVKPFRPVPGMADLLSAAARRGAVVCYVSASPWQLYNEFREFFAHDGFPRGLFHLKYFRLKDENFFQLFVKGYEYKIKTIEPVMKKFPDARFVLIGDSGEMDPEAYAELASRYPDRVAKILIRNAYNEDEPGRYAKIFSGVPRDRWRVFKNSAEIRPDLPR